MADFDNLEIDRDEILTADELEAAPAGEEIPAAESDTPDAADPAPDEIPKLDDALVQTLAAANAAMQAAEARISELEARLKVLEAQEAARAKKLTGFFAPVKTGRNPDGDPLPRIDRNYTF